MKVAVIGSGISGLTAAYYLRNDHDVHVLEADVRPGGHSNTVTVLEGDRDVPVDTGFIVFNEVTYPGFTSLLDQLDVDAIDTDMSFAVSCASHGLEYSSSGLKGMLAQPIAMARPSRVRMVREINRFYREAKEMLEANGWASDQSLGDFLDDRRYGAEFRRHFIVPLVGAIWSTPPQVVDAYPVRHLFGFLYNHGLLGWSERLQWRTVRGGSRRYVDALIDRLPNGVRLHSPVASVTRRDWGIDVRFSNGTVEEFDRVVMACHSDQALRLIDDPTHAESSALRGIRYEESSVALHTDARVMPQRRRAWASWNYTTDTCTEVPGPVTISYHMNRLQRLDAQRDYFVTVNPQVELDTERVIARFDYAHPQFEDGTVKAQRTLRGVSGRGGIHFAGAYLGHGFHEDGYRSGLQAAIEIAGVPAIRVAQEAAA